ncbi:MAG: DMT family transporter [Phycisphaerales bacterium]|nr:DMT family transporter [Phycisphaerales bacterium]
MKPNTNAVRADMMLLLVAAIWGSGFVAQRTAMDHIGPFAFNTVRYAIGAIVLLPIILRKPRMTRIQLAKGVLLGLVMAAAAGLQQLGMVDTTAPRAGFITGLYVLFVPLLALCFGQRTNTGHILGIILAALGMYLLAGDLSGTVGRGDLMIALCAVVWALHVVLVAWLVKSADPISLAFVQFVTVAAVSLIVERTTETTALTGLQGAAGAILFSGVLVVGVAFTLQIIAQKHAPPTHAAIIMSLEAVFGALFGWLLLRETLSSKELLGCALMFAGMILAQLWPHKRTKAEAAELIDPVR